MNHMFFSVLSAFINFVEIVDFPDPDKPMNQLPFKMLFFVLQSKPIISFSIFLNKISPHPIAVEYKFRTSNRHM